MVEITDHAMRRCRKRMGLQKKAIQKMAETAFNQGKQHKDFSGSFRRYLDGEFLKDKTASNMRVWNGYLFIFAGETLITAWLLPGKYRRHT